MDDVSRTLKHIRAQHLTIAQLKRLCETLLSEDVVRAEREEREAVRRGKVVVKEGMIACLGPDVPPTLFDDMWTARDPATGKLRYFHNQPQDRVSKLVAVEFLKIMFTYTITSFYYPNVQMYMDTRLHHGTQSDPSQQTDDITLQYGDRVILIDAKIATTLKFGKTHSYQLPKSVTGHIDALLVILPMPSQTTVDPVTKARMTVKACSTVVETAKASSLSNALDMVKAVFLIPIDVDNPAHMKETLSVNLEHSYVMGAETRPKRHSRACLYAWRRPASGKSARPNDMAAGHVVSPHLATWLETGKLDPATKEPCT